jgi:WD40 repeat protein
MPYPGMRSFEITDKYDESLIFFGRQNQVYELIDRLADSHLVAVLGPSGCGKSSLVRVGLIPHLDSGYLYKAGARWVTTIMEPGGHPVRGLSQALAKAVTKSSVSGDRAQVTDIELDLEKRLNQRPDALVQFSEQISPKLGERTNLLILIDQFEEIFRTDLTSSDEATHLINLILNVFHARPDRFYIVITMRTDYLGQCAHYLGLPEALNQTQYLTPRLNIEELREAIVQPVQLEAYGGRIETPLVRRILNEMSEEATYDPDRLPLMQHALMWMWQDAVRRSEENHAHPVLKLADYERFEGLADCLSKHANAVISKLSASQQKIADVMFSLLSDFESGERVIRRVTTPSEIAAVGGFDVKAVVDVIDVFASEKNCFVRWKSKPEKVDVTHESLIRQWDALEKKTREKAKAAATYQELKRPAHSWQACEGGLWKAIGGLRRGLDLRRAVEWQKQWGALWSTAHAKDIAAVEKFVHASRIFERIRWGTYIVLVVLALLGFKLILDHISTREKLQIEKTLREKAERYRDDAEFLRDEAMKNESELGANLSLTQTAQGYSTAGMILALDVLPRGEVKRPYVHKAERALYAALHVPHEVSILEGHENVVEFGAFSPNGKWVATGSWDRTARIWNAETGDLMHILEGHDGAVSYVAFSPSGDAIVTASLDPVARVWDVETGRKIHDLNGHTGMIQQAVFNPQGDRLVTASSDFTARIWDVETGEVIHVLKGHDDVVEQAVFNPQGTLVLTASWDKTARIWDAKTGRLIHQLNGHTLAIGHAAFDSTGDNVVTVSADKTARIWDVKTGGAVRVLRGHTGEVLYAAFNPGGDRIVTASRDNTARIWNVETGAEIIALRGHTGAVVHAEFSPQAGGGVVTASEDASARLWDSDTGELVYPLKRHESKLFHAFFSPEGDRVLTVSHDHTARIWYTKPNILRGHEDAIVDAAFSPQSDLIVTASKDGTARIWRAADRKAMFVLEGHQGTVLRALFSPRGNRVVTASEDATARVWSAETGELLFVLDKHRGPVLSVAFSPKSDRLVTASADTTVRLWNVETGTETRVLRGHTDEVLTVDFNPAGDRIVTGSKDKMACVWNAETGARTIVFDHHTDAVLSAKFSPAGDVVATSSADRTICLWDPNSGELLRPPLTGHNSAILKTVFGNGDKVSKGVQWLVSIADDRAALLWKLDDLKSLTGAQEQGVTPIGGLSEPSTLEDRRPLNLNHDAPVKDASFNPTGNRVATASEDGTAVLWSVSADRVAVLKGHKTSVNSVVFSPDQPLVLTASEDGSARLWEVFEDTQTLVDHAQKVVNDRRLSLKEHNRIYGD